MENKIFYDNMTIGFVVIIGIGLFLALEFQQKSVEPLDSAIGYLDRVIASSDHRTILSGIELIKQNVPKEGNPVFIYPTVSTDFARMQTDLDIMLTNVLKISDAPVDSSAYHTGMLDLHSRADVLRENIMDAKLYLYASIPNVLFTMIWLGGALGLVETLIRK